MRLKVDLNVVLAEFEGSGKLVWIYLKEEEFVTMRDVSAKLKREYPGLGGVKFSFYIQDGLVPKNESVAILRSDDILVLKPKNLDYPVDRSSDADTGMGSMAPDVGKSPEEKSPDDTASSRHQVKMIMILPRRLVPMYPELNCNLNFFLILQQLVNELKAQKKIASK